MVPANRAPLLRLYEDRSAASLLHEVQTLLPGRRHGLANPLVFMNAREIGDAAHARWLHWCHAARDAVASPVLLGRYPRGALLDGEGSFQLLLSGCRVADQPPYPGEKLDDTLTSLRRRASTAVEVDRPCLLACRTGEWTWGHWLLDMLPKIVMAERAAPKQFTYAVPAGIVDPAVGGGFAAAVLDSLAAYGVAPSRLLRVRADAAYRCAALFDVTGISGKHLHPGVLAALREVELPDVTPLPLLGVCRAPPSTRWLVNAPAVHDVLAAEGCVFLDPRSSRFAGQAAAFRSADIVVGDLGSNLAAAIYARPATGLVTLAPTGWQDDYFAKLFQRLGVLQADVRGHALPATGQPLQHAPYIVNPTDVSAGLAALRDAMGSAGQAARRLDGRIVAPALGAVLAELTFGVGGDAQPALRTGFSAPEPGGTWSVGRESELRLPCPAQNRPVWLEIEAACLTAPPHLVSRPVGVSVNGVRLADLDAGEQIHAHVLVPAGLLASDELAVTIHTPVHPSPHCLGLSGDRRELGVMARRVAVRDVCASR